MTKAAQLSGKQQGARPQPQPPRGANPPALQVSGALNATLGGRQMVR